MTVHLGISRYLVPCYPLQAGVLSISADEEGERVLKQQVKCNGATARHFVSKSLFKRTQYHVDLSHASLDHPVHLYATSQAEHEKLIAALRFNGTRLA